MERGYCASRTTAQESNSGFVDLHASGDRAFDRPDTGQPPLASLSMKGREQSHSSSAASAEAVRVRRLREDARRPHSVNLAEGIALSHKLMRFTGAARST
jgi:hypothetical protein